MARKPQDPGFQAFLRDQGVQPGAFTDLHNQRQNRLERRFTGGGLGDNLPNITAPAPPVVDNPKGPRSPHRNTGPGGGRDVARGGDPGTLPDNPRGPRSPNRNTGPGGGRDAGGGGGHGGRGGRGGGGGGGHHGRRGRGAIPQIPAIPVTPPVTPPPPPAPGPIPIPDPSGAFPPVAVAPQVPATTLGVPGAGGNPGFTAFLRDQGINANAFNQFKNRRQNRLRQSFGGGF